MSLRKTFYLLLTVALVVGMGTMGNTAVIQTLDIGEAGDDSWGTGENAIPTANWGSTETYQTRSARLKSVGLGDFCVMTIEEGGGTMLFTYYDDSALAMPNNARLFINDLDGDTWEDIVIGDLPFDGLDAWRTVGLPLSEDLYNGYIANQACMDDVGDAPWLADFSSADGYQPVFYQSLGNVWGNLEDTPYFDKIEIDTTKIWTLDVGDSVDASFSDRLAQYLNRANVDDGWYSAITTIGGENCRVTDGVNVVGFVIALDSDIENISITVYDDDASEAPGFSLWADYQDGDTWKDSFIMNVPLDGTGGWETTTWVVPDDLYANGGDVRPGTGGLDCDSTGRHFDRQGHQVLINIWGYDATEGAGDPAASTATIAIDEITVDNLNEVPVELLDFSLE